MQKKLQQRFNALTGIRAIAASMVFLYHNRKYWRDWLPEFVIRNFNEYHTGVTLFFVLSGFLIAYTYKDAPTQNFKAYTKYIAVRIARIFPVFLLLLGIQYWHWGFPARQHVGWNFSLLKGFSDVHNLDGIAQSWTLTVELCFYILAPFIFFFINKSVWKTWLGLLLLGLTAVGIGYLWHNINGNPNRWLYNWWFVADATFFGRFTEFFVGVFMAYAMQKKYAWLQWFSGKRITLIAGVLCLLVIYSISWWEKTIYNHGTETIAGLCIRNLLLPVVMAIFLYGLITEETWVSKFLATKTMVLLGNASYIFYLIHMGYLNQLIAAKKLMFDRNFILVWLIAIAGYLLFEKPIYNLCRKWI